MAVTIVSITQIINCGGMPKKHWSRKEVTQAFSFPTTCQKADDEEIAIYFATPHGPFEPRKRPRVPVFRDNETDEGADRPLTRPKLFAKAAYDSGVAMAQVTCAGRSRCYSKTIAGDVAAVRIKRTWYSVPLAVYRKG